MRADRSAAVDWQVQPIEASAPTRNVAGRAERVLTVRRALTRATQSRNSLSVSWSSAVRICGPYDARARSVVAGGSSRDTRASSPRSVDTSARGPDVERRSAREQVPAKSGSGSPSTACGQRRPATARNRSVRRGASHEQPRGALASDATVAAVAPPAAPDVQLIGIAERRPRRSTVADGDHHRRSDELFAACTKASRSHALPGTGESAPTASSSQDLRRPAPTLRLDARSG